MMTPLVVVLSSGMLLNSTVLISDGAPVYAQTNTEISHEADQLLEQGYQQDSFWEYQAAFQSLKRALKLYRQIGNRKGEAAAIRYLGRVYLSLKQNQKAITFFQQSLEISRQIGDHLGEHDSLSHLIAFYEYEGPYAKAINLHQRVVEITREIGDQAGEAHSLGDMGIIYQYSGQYSKAINVYKQCLEISREIGIRGQESDCLRYMGNTYYALGQYKKAAIFYQQSLEISRLEGDRANESDTLGYLGNIYYALGQYKKAINFHQQDLEIKREIRVLTGLSNSLNYIGNAYHALGQYKKAINLFQESIETSGDRVSDATALGYMGNAYYALGKYEKAFTHYQQSLSLSQALGNHSISGLFFSKLGDLLAEQQQPELAIVFLKQSVNLREQIRKNLKGFSQQEKQSYTDTVADSYRHLADLLLQQDRVLEAQSVLDLLKVQELDDYLKGVRGTGKQLDLLQPEIKILQRYKESQKSTIALTQELDQLTQLAQSGKITPEQKQRRLKLLKLTGALRSQFTDFLRQPQIQQLLTQLSRDTTRESINLRNLASLQDNLAKVKGALLSPLILDDRLELVLTMPIPNAPPLRRTVKVKRTELNQTIVEYRQALQDPNVDARPQANKLYNWLVKPIEADLKQANISHLLYAPDGQLRYIPLAALHDGQQWLTQSYQITNITTTSFTDFDTKPQANPRILAGALADNKISRTVTAGQKTQTFGGLRYAGEEVRTLIAARPNTTALIDRDLTLDRALQEMGLHQIIHLATHAAFVPSDPEDSFIVFGEGKNPTLRDIADWPLSNVDLVILSACETAVGGKLGNGAEVLGLGYQFQQSGSKAVIASLWQVNDGGTQKLMTEFYAALQPGTTKTEALRKAQVALITGSQATDGSKKRSSVDLSLGKGSQSSNIENNLSHPYYWAPFILIGNGL